MNTVNLTEQDDPIFHQSNHVTYQLTQWPHSINTNIKEKHQYHTQYHINLEKWFITGLQLLIRLLTAVCSVSEQNLMFLHCSQLNVKSYSNPYYQTNCSSYHRLFLPQYNVEVHSAPDHFLLNLQVADEISKRILILSFHITQQLWSCFQI